MWPIATDRVEWYVCRSASLSFTTVRRAKMAESLNQTRCHLGCRLGWAQRTMYLMGALDPTCQGAVLRAKRGRPRCSHVWQLIYSVRHQGAEPVWCRCQLWCTRSGAHWLHLANRAVHVQHRCGLVWNYFEHLIFEFLLIHCLPVINLDVICCIYCYNTGCYLC